MVSTYATLYQQARRALLPREGSMAANTARELLCAASGKCAEEVIAQRDIYAPEATCRKMAEFLRRAMRDEPLAYILGEWDFYGMTLKITPDVLIPRDDTIVVTELAIHYAMHLDQNPRVLDLCTGSGCIGLAVAKRVRDARVTLGDISPAALRVAKTNAHLQKLSGRVSSVTVDAMQPAAKFLGTFDLIVSNPPYVTKAEMLTLQPSVREYEPALALDGGEDGLNFYRAILDNFTPTLRPGGFVCFEFGMGQEQSVCQLLTEHGYEVLELKSDTSEIIRAVAAQKKEDT